MVRHPMTRYSSIESFGNDIFNLNIVSTSIDSGITIFQNIRYLDAYFTKDSYLPAISGINNLISKLSAYNTEHKDDNLEHFLIFLKNILNDSEKYKFIIIESNKFVVKINNLLDEDSKDIKMILNFLKDMEFFFKFKCYPY
jgi:hypothetical protein